MSFYILVLVAFADVVVFAVCWWKLRRLREPKTPRGRKLKIVLRICLFVVPAHFCAYLVYYMLFLLGRG